MKDLLGSTNSMSEEKRTSFILISYSNGNARQVDMKSGTERAWEDEGQVEISLLQRSTEVEIFPKGSHPSSFLKRDYFVNLRKRLPQIDQISRNKDGQVGFGKKTFQSLNGRKTEDRIPHPVDPSHQDTVDLAQIGFQGFSFFPQG